MRRLRALVLGLPHGSRALDPHDWGNAEELLAGLLEATDNTNRLLVAINTPKGSRQPEPVRVTRPWELEERSRPRTRRNATLAEVVDILKLRRVR